MKKNIFYLLTIALMGLTAVSCGEDDEPEPAFSVSPTSLIFALEGGTQNITVTAENTSWTATTDANWLTLTKAEGSLSVTATAHTGSENRTGIISITSGNDKITLNVTQKGISENEEPLLRRIANITRHDGNGTISATYEYDNKGRVVNIYCIGDSKTPDILSISYPESNTVKIVDSATNGVANTQTLTLNSNGYVSSFANTGSDYVNGGGSGQITYTNGYITKAISSWKIMDFTWSGGSLTMAKNNYDGIVNTETFEYGTVENNLGNIDLNWLLINRDLSDISIFDLAGKRSKYLASKITDDDNEKGGTELHRYVTDSEGYVTKIYSQSEEDGSEYLEYTIDYED